MNPAIFTTFLVGNYSTSWGNIVSVTSKALQGSAEIHAGYANMSIELKQTYKDYRVAQKCCLYDGTHCDQMTALQRKLHKIPIDELGLRGTAIVIVTLDMLYMSFMYLIALACAIKSLVIIALFGFS